MAERYIHGFYSPDVFCALVVRASVIPMDEHDKRVVYLDMLEALIKFLNSLQIGQAYSIDFRSHTLLSKLNLLSKQHPEHRNHKHASVNTAHMLGMLVRLDAELFIYNQLVKDENDRSDTMQP
ncbi:MAG: hypothetical protein Greene101415_103 [Parcubacteria group bacterium Greene1014_15]|nr:MAG: hypothetical protein Greene101415_103 [Parcubacteria group bacterium Greene1014_15]